MGLRIEVIIFASIVIILLATSAINIKNKSSLEEINTKELIFRDTTIIEVDQNRTLGSTYSTYGIRDAGILTLSHIEYSTDDIKLLRAKKGIFVGKKVYLDGDISVNQKKGFDCTAQSAVYNKKTGILNVTSPFTAIVKGNIMHGKSMRYDINRNILYAKVIHAIVYTAEANISN